MFTARSESARSEFAEWDPFSPQPSAIGALTVDDAGDGPVKEHGPQVIRKWPKKYRRAPARDITPELSLYVAGVAQTFAVFNERLEKWDLPDDVLQRIANEFNLRTDNVARFWRRDETEEITPAELAARAGACAAEIGALRRLAPLRHLIAIANKPHEAEDGEIDRAAEGLGTLELVPDLHRTICDLALMLDLTAKVNELRESVVRELHAHYERRVDAEPTVKTLLVNWCRDHRPTPVIYPPGVSRWLGDEEKVSS